MTQHNTTKPLSRHHGVAGSSRPRSSVNRLALLWTGVILGLLSAPADVGGQAAHLREYDLKAAHLYHIAHYVSWPTNTDAPLTIGVFGSDRFGEALSMLEGKSAKGRRLIVKRLASEQEIASCQMVFIAASETERLPELLELAAGHSVLTVGEVSGFAEQGGMINLVAERNKVKLEVNRNALTRAHLTISSEVLKLARLVPD